MLLPWFLGSRTTSASAEKCRDGLHALGVHFGQLLLRCRQLGVGLRREMGWK